MKKMRKLLALLIATAMVLGLGVTAFAADVQHTITINNSDQYVSHNYEAYQVFAGDLLEENNKKILSNITWGNGVDGDALLDALQNTDDPDLLDTNDESLFKDCTSAADVAKVLETFNDTTGNLKAGPADAFAEIVADNLGSTSYTFTEDPDTVYTATVTGDGYYFIQDVTEEDDLIDEADDGSSKEDTTSKFILAVVGDVEVNAKDTGTYLDKSITGEGETKLKEGSSAIGDEIPFEVKTKCPSTIKFDEYVFIMHDTLDAGLTYFGDLEVTINGTTVPADDYVVTVKTGTADFTTPTTVAAAVTTTGGQTITIDFSDSIKDYGDSTTYAGKDIVITYKAVLNEKATMGTTANENEVYFEYSNNPNDEESMGTTPEVVTKTYSTELNVLKVDGESEALEGAVFELSGTTTNFVLVTGEKFETADYEVRDGEEMDTTTKYYQLAGGSYTDVAPTTATMPKYKNDTEYYKVTMTAVVEDTEGGTVAITVVSGADGKMKFTGLKPGTYTLKEIAAPEGFNLITDPVEFTIKWDKTNGWQEDVAEGADPVLTLEAGTFYIDIINESGAELPSTGGIGTTIFYALGTILVLGAGIVLVTRHRMNAQ